MIPSSSLFFRHPVTLYPTLKTLNPLFIRKVLYTKVYPQKILEISKNFVWSFMKDLSKAYSQNILTGNSGYFF